MDTGQSEDLHRRLRATDALVQCSLIKEMVGERVSLDDRWWCTRLMSLVHLTALELLCFFQSIPTVDLCKPNSSHSADESLVLLRAGKAAALVKNVTARDTFRLESV